MTDLSKKSFLFIACVIFLAILITRFIGHTTGFPDETFDHQLIVYAVDLGFFILVFFGVSSLLDNTGLFKDKE